MPFRLNEYRARVQFLTSAEMPSLITKAAERTGKVSNTQYIQHVLAHALAKDLDLSEDEILAALPPAKLAIPPFITDGTRHTHPKKQASLEG